MAMGRCEHTIGVCAKCYGMANDLHRHCEMQDEIRLEEILKLCKEIDAKNARIAALESQLADRDAEIGRLREDLREVRNEWESSLERVDGAKVLLADRDAEIEQLRADLVWAVRNDVEALGIIQVDLFIYGEHVSRCDDTPDSICRAVRAMREARDGTS